MFTAYNAVAFTQYALYTKYAELTPSVATAKLAQEIWYAGLEQDAELRKFTKSLNWGLASARLVYSEYMPFAIRSADGEAWDIYLLDDDRDCIAMAAAVPTADGLARLLEIGQPFAHTRDH